MTSRLIDTAREHYTEHRDVSSIAVVRGGEGGRAMKSCEIFMEENMVT